MRAPAFPGITDFRLWKQNESEWKTGTDELFKTCSNCDVKNKLEKPIQHFLDLFINTSSNHISIRSCLVSQPNKN